MSTLIFIFFSNHPLIHSKTGLARAASATYEMGLRGCGPHGASQTRGEEQLRRETGEKGVNKTNETREEVRRLEQRFHPPGKEPHP